MQNSTRRAWIGFSALGAIACGSSLPPKYASPAPTDASADPPAPLAATTAPTSGAHHHVESCWLDPERAYRDDTVDMMLVVVGLNHRSGSCIRCAVGGDGVGRLADAIHEAWPHPDSVVVVGSAFGGACACVTTDPPVPAQRLADELGARYGQPFTVGVAEGPDPRWPGSMGVVSGTRWVPTKTQRLQYTDWATLVDLRDRVTGLTVPVFAVHTGTNGPPGSVDDMRRAIAYAKAQATQAAQAGDATYTVPIVAGDFNFTETREGSLVEANLTQTLDANVIWSNKDVACVEAGGLPADTLFQAQDGNKMHAFTGRLSAGEAAFSNECAVADLERVRFSYSVDATGQLAVRPEDEGVARPAQREGIILDDIAHNVLAIGLSIHRREDPLPRTCTVSPPPTCPASRPWCDCSGRCDTSANCRNCEDGVPDCTNAKPYCECTGSCLARNECDRVCR